ncbi:hypothetical protein NDU88_008910 [Pleurodeles waltl]|uniref:Uncharacterized protein n=1 Tax=Pleurodeles waltl TaxID=8319 RepID=A0AAV7NZD0_PLEWA|nr:hypothetical protein NDU88_008910 [Pleurodeles waltl]
MWRSAKWRLGRCSRETDSPATSHIESGAERRSADSCGYEIKVIGNPDGRIPEHVPVRGGEEETIAGAGNLDIRVPDSLNREEGLLTGHALKTGDAEGGEQLNEGKRVTHGQTLVEDQPNTGRDDPTTRQDGPRKLENRHVPGGTWLRQVIGNPDGWIPEHVPVRDGEEETIAGAGNPDIRVPDNLNREEGLRPGGALKTGDAEGGEDEQGGEQLNKGKRVTHGQTLVEEQPDTGRDDPTAG